MALAIHSTLYCRKLLINDCLLSNDMDTKELFSAEINCSYGTRSRAIATYDLNLQLCIHCRDVEEELPAEIDATPCLLFP